MTLHFDKLSRPVRHIMDQFLLSAYPYCAPGFINDIKKLPRDGDIELLFPDFFVKNDHKFSMGFTFGDWEGQFGNLEGDFFLNNSF